MIRIDNYINPDAAAGRAGDAAVALSTSAIAEAAPPNSALTGSASGSAQIWDRETQRSDGGPNNPLGLGGKSGKIVTLYEIQGDKPATEDRQRHHQVACRRR